MSDKDKHLEEEVWAAIAAFEQILEAIPNDRSSLEALSHAYAQIGDHTRAKEYLIRLAKIVLADNDASGCEEMASTLEKYKEQDPAIPDILAKLEQLQTRQPSRSPSSAAGRPARLQPRASSGFSMSDALSFAWNLTESGQITQEEYSSIVQDLTDLSASAATTTVSVLHVLENNYPKKIEKILAYVADERRTPFIALSSFTIRKKALSLLPLDFMIRHGVLVFELLGDEALTATLNPYNQGLQKEVETITKRPCHFFVTLPSDFDQVMAQAPKILAEENDDEDEE